MQGYRYCVAGEDLVIVSVHYKHSGASAFLYGNEGHNLQIYNNGQPYAVAVGDIVPAQAVRIEPLGNPRKRRRRIGD